MLILHLALTGWLSYRHTDSDRSPAVLADRKQDYLQQEYPRTGPNVKAESGNPDVF